MQSMTKLFIRGILTVIIGYLFLFMGFLNVYAQTGSFASCALSPTPATAGGGIFYVDKNNVSCTDSGPGSASQPWCKIQTAATKLTAGQTVYIKPGIYNEQIIPQNSGNATQGYITYTADSSLPDPSSIITDPSNLDASRLVIINGTGLSFSTYNRGLIQIGHIDSVGLNYIKVSRLVFQHSPNQGIRVDKSSFITLEKNYTYDTKSSGIIVAQKSNNVIVDNNEIVLACNGGSEELLSIAESAYKIEIKNNYIHDGGYGTDLNGYGGEGVNVKNGSYCIFVHNNKNYYNTTTPNTSAGRRYLFGVDGYAAETHHVWIYNNIGYNSNYGFAVESEEGAYTHDIYVFNNVSINNATGYFLPQWGSNYTALKENIYFLNNVSYNDTKAFYLYNPNTKNVVMKNNLISKSGTDLIISSGGISQTTVDSNIFSGTGCPTGVTCTNSITTTDPKFIAPSVNPNTANFRLTSASVAIDKGANISAYDVPSTDFAGVSRPQGNGVDIGAYEYTSGITTPSPSPGIAGDANGDGHVDINDYKVWFNHFGLSISGINNGNFNGNSLVDGLDYIIWMTNFGKY
jgi:hypothetical protein